jgi:hypothetical protein
MQQKRGKEGGCGRVRLHSTGYNRKTLPKNPETLDSHLRVEHLVMLSSQSGSRTKNRNLIAWNSTLTSASVYFMVEIHGEDSFRVHGLLSNQNWNQTPSNLPHLNSGIRKTRVHD